MKIAHKKETAQPAAANNKLAKMPKPPGWFKCSATAKKIYTELAARLIEAHPMAEIDQYGVLMLAVAFEQYNWATAEIARKNSRTPGAGYVQHFATGASNISAELTVREKAHRQILELANRFGLTLRDRITLKTPNGDPAQLDFYELFTMKVAK